MSPDAVALLFLAVPLVVLMLLRVNASLVFLSACLGAVLLHYVGNDAADFANMFLPFLSGNNLRLALVFLPVVLTTIFMIKTVRGASLLFNILPAVGTGLLIAIMAIPLLPHDLAVQVQASSVWHTLQQVQALAVGASALVCLFFLWTQRPKHSQDKHAKHHKKG